MDSRLFRTIIAALVLACAARIVTAAQGNPEAAKVKNPVAVNSRIDCRRQGRLHQVRAMPRHQRRGRAGQRSDSRGAEPG
mgnify:CR=1 FL=1